MPGIAARRGSRALRAPPGAHLAAQHGRRARADDPCESPARRLHREALPAPRTLASRPDRGGEHRPREGRRALHGPSALLRVQADGVDALARDLGLWRRRLERVLWRHVDEARRGRRLGHLALPHELRPRLLHVDGAERQLRALRLERAARGHRKMCARMSRVACRVSRVACRVSRVACRMSHVACRIVGRLQGCDDG